MSKLLTPNSTALDKRKYITFSLHGYLFALLSQDVLKIVVAPSKERGTMLDIGLVQLAQYSIQILELPELLKLDSEANSTEGLKLGEDVADSTVDSLSFLIILQPAKELWGIVVNQPPDLLNILPNQLKLVPTTKRIAGALRGISHLITRELTTDEPLSNGQLSSSQKHEVILVLDCQKLVELSQAQTDSTSNRSSLLVEHSISRT